MRFEYRIVLGKFLARVEPGIRFEAVFAQFLHSLLIRFEHAGYAPHGELGNRIALRERVQVAATVEHRIEAEKYDVFIRSAGRYGAEANTQAGLVGYTAKLQDWRLTKTETIDESHE